MAFKIRVSGQHAEQELRSLYAWLQDEPSVRRHAQISLVPEKPRPGELGAALKIIQLVIDSGFQAVNFALAYATWRDTRPSQPEITIETHDMRLTLDGADPDVVQKIVRAIE